MSGKLAYSTIKRLHRVTILVCFHVFSHLTFLLLSCVFIFPVCHLYYYKILCVVMYVCMYVVMCVCLYVPNGLKTTGSNRMPFGTKSLYVPGKVLDYFDF